MLKHKNVLLAWRFPSIYANVSSKRIIQIKLKCYEETKKRAIVYCLVRCFDSLRPINNLSVIKGRVFFG